MWFGVTLVVVGIIFLLDNFGFLSHRAWDVIWPALIILIGIYLIAKKPQGNTEKKTEEKK